TKVTITTQPLGNLAACFLYARVYPRGYNKSSASHLLLYETNRTIENSLISQYTKWALQMLDV
ncbi:hypothetical protein N9J07_04225, partial [Bacteroidia bacterium]|nr:hypothetical protein [Bacteroidia bacterium]